MPITDANSTMNQSQFKAKTCNQCQVHVTKSILVLVLLFIGWESGVSCEPITEHSDAKAYLLRHSIENCSIAI